MVVLVITVVVVVHKAVGVVVAVDAVVDALAWNAGSSRWGLHLQSASALA